MKTILFVLPSLRGGGSEKVMFTLLKELDRQKYHLELALVNYEGVYLQDVPKDVKIHDLGAKRVRNAVVPLFKLIKRQNPDIVFSTQGHLNIMIIILKIILLRKITIIVRESNTVSQIIKYNKHPKIWNFLYKHVYKHADMIVCQSDFMRNDLNKNFLVPKNKTIRIYNPVDVLSIREKALSEENPFKDSKAKINIVAIGRLSQQKGYDRLLSSLTNLLKLEKSFKVWILGEGILENDLKIQSEELGLEKHIEFAGFQNNPYKWLVHADLYVMTSYYEGLPNSLLEAIACKCPILVIDHPGGTAEILKKLGLEHQLCKDELNFNKNVFNKDEEYSIKEFERIFGVEKIIGDYENLFDNFGKN